VRVVAAVHFFATPDDETALLDYLGEPDVVTLHPWPVVTSALPAFERGDLGSRRQVMIARRDLGRPHVIGGDDAAMSEPSKAGIFNKLNWQRLRPSSDERLVDSNASPVLLWQRGGVEDSTVQCSDIGSQADSIAAISREYERWVNRVIGWVRRRGTRVWGLERHALREDLDIELSYVNNIYALPSALKLLESGGSAR
jgi:hypothetical protein